MNLWSEDFAISNKSFMCTKLKIIMQPSSHSRSNDQKLHNAEKNCGLLNLSHWNIMVLAGLFHRKQSASKHFLLIHQSTPSWSHLFTRKRFWNGIIGFLLSYYQTEDIEVSAYLFNTPLTQLLFQKFEK